jgi:predicted RecA/RadA family phage recombinase
MKAEFVYKGDNLDFVNGTGSDIAAGDVIKLQSRIGIAGTDIPDGTKGSVVMEGVFKLPKKDADAVAMGTAVYWSDDGITIASEGNTAAGYAAEASAAGASTMEVKLLG